MQREGVLHLARESRVEQALFEHDARAVAGFFARLKHEQHAAGEPLACVREHARGAHQHRHVRVVPAGVRTAGDLGAERRAALFLHRERVHIAAEQDGRAGSRAVEPRADRAQARARANLQR